MLCLPIILFTLLYQVVANPAPQKIGRIVGGQTARAGQFPFVAALSVQTSDSQFFCGGTIITHKYILTAGHCVDGAILFTIQVGSNYLEGEDGNRYTAATSDYILHPNYNPQTLENNLGFVVLRMDMTMIVGYLWSINYLPTADLEPGEDVMAIGWGQVDDTIPEIVNELNYVDLVTISNAECKITYGNQVTDEMICVAGNYNQGTCIGDSGGPLVQDIFIGFMMQVGIATFVSGNGCESTDPTGFTRIYPHLDWIKNITNRI